MTDSFLKKSEKMKNLMGFQNLFKKITPIKLRATPISLPIVFLGAAFFATWSFLAVNYLSGMTDNNKSLEYSRIHKLYAENPVAFAEFLHLLEHKDENKNTLSLQFLELLKSSALDPNLNESMPIQLAANYIEIKPREEPERELTEAEEKVVEPTDKGVTPKDATQRDLVQDDVCYTLSNAKNIHLREVSNPGNGFQIKNAKIAEKERVSLYAVTIEPKFARDARNLEKLTQAKQKGYYLITQDGPLRGHLSIGVFSQYSSANALMKKLSKSNLKGLGIRPKAKETISTITVNLPSQHAKKFERFADTSLKIKAQPCTKDSQA